MLALLLLLAATAAFAHPANVCVAKAKVGLDRSLEFRIHFDIIAFACEERPTIIADAPMNALLDGPEDDLNARLADAKKRLLRDLKVEIDGKPTTLDSYQFPSRAEILSAAAESPQARLPVMMTVVFNVHMPADAKAAKFTLPALLDTVILTTELPYQEPAAEPVEPGQSSSSIQIPTKAEIDKLAASFTRPRAEQPPTSNLAEVRKAIQAKYDAWTKAYTHNDVDTLLSILATDYTLKPAKGDVLSYAEYATGLKLKRGKPADTKTYTQKLLNLTLQGGIAAIYSRETTIVTKPAPDGKVASTTFVHDYIDTWIWRGGKWLLQSTVTQRELIGAKAIGY